MDFPEGLANFDIGLAPITRTAFNCAKSNLKLLEYSAYKIPWVASKVAPYARLKRYCEGGFLAEGDGWITAISTLIENEQARREMGQNGYEVCYHQFNLEKNFANWPNAWRLIQDNVDNGYFGEPKLDAPPSKHRYRKSPYQIYGRIGRNDPCPCGCGLKYKKCVSYGAWGE
jgi:hypothetical protein